MHHTHAHILQYEVPFLGGVDQCWAFLHSSDSSHSTKLACFGRAVVCTFREELEKLLDVVGQSTFSCAFSPSTGAWMVHEVD